MATVNLLIPLSREAIAALKRIAREERRRPQDQAAVLLERALASSAKPQEAATCASQQ